MEARGPQAPSDAAPAVSPEAGAHAAASQSRAPCGATCVGTSPALACCTRGETARARDRRAVARPCFCWSGTCSPKYRVNIYVRFLNVPSPEAVYESLMRAIARPQIPRCTSLLSCRRIFFGFLLAAVVAVRSGC